MLASLANQDMRTSLDRIDAIDRALASNDENFDPTELSQLRQRAIFARAAVIQDGASTSPSTTGVIATLERDVSWSRRIISGVPLSLRNALFVGSGVLLVGAAGVFLTRAMRGKGRRR